MKKLLVICLILQVCFKVNAQNLPELTPPSPTAYELTKYGDIPINEFTGLASINIPITNYNIGSLNVPISLNYTTSGIKVDQVASWVGLGWNLNVGGIITREIRGIADERNTREFRTLDTILDWRKNQYGKFINFVKSISEDVSDGEPDVFTFNFNGYSGSFYLDINFNPVAINKRKELKIERTGTETIIGGFKITTPNGISYYFSNAETARNDYIISGVDQGGHPMPNDNMERRTAWFLTKITHFNGDEIYFEYNYTASYNDVTGFSQEFRYITGIQGDNGNCSSPPQTGLNTTVFKSYLSTVKVSKISNNRNDNTVVFNATKARADLPSEYRLNSIQLKDGATIIGGYNFSYETVTSSVSYNGALNKPWLGATAHKKRMFLTSVQQTDANESIVNGEKHIFDYHDKAGMPPRFSFSQDYLGFYNGISNASYLPENVNYLNYFNGVNRGDRSANFDYAKKGILTKVTYPTGGYTVLNYEPAIELVTTTSQNDIYSNFGMNVDNTNQQDTHTQNLNILYNQTIQFSPNLTILNGGTDYVHDIANIKIKNLTTNAIIFNENINHTFNGSFNVSLNANTSYEFKVYFDNNKLFDGVATNFSFNYKSGEHNTSTASPQDRSGIRIQKIISTTDSTATPIIKKYFYAQKENLSNETLQHIGMFGFLEIDEGVFGGICPPYSGTLGSAISYDKYSLKSSSIGHFYLTAPFYTSYTTVTTSIGEDFEGGGIEKHFDLAGVQLSPSRIWGGDNPEEEVSRKLDLKINNGNLLREVYFEKDDTTIKIVSEKKYTYNVQDNNNAIDVYFGVRPLSQPSGFSSDNLTEIIGYDVYNYKLYSKKMSLDSIITTNFYGNNSVVTSQKYSYESNLVELPTEILSINSTGDILKTQYTYPNVSTTQGLQNRFDVIETKNYKGNTLLSHQKTQYKNWGNDLVLPEFIKTAKGAQSLEDRITYHNYDNKGNPTEVSKKDGTHIVYIWGYNQSQPIAKIENATESQVTAAIGTLNGSYNTLAEIQTLSNNDTNDSSENSLRTALADLRAALPNNAMMSSFTYDPLIGVTSVTDPRGRTQFYHYDSFNRLQYVKDHEGNILSENQYNYKN